jgi:hypothetical protein
MAYRRYTVDGYYEDGYSANEYHGAFHRGGFQNRYSENFNYGYNNNACAFQNRVTSHQEVDEPSLKDLRKSFIRAQAKTDEALENQYEALENQLKELNEKIEQDDRSYQASMQDWEMRLDQMEERFSNELTGQLIQNTQQNPSPHGKTSWYCEEDYYSEDEEGNSPKFNESGLDTGQNEQQNEELAAAVSTATQSYPLRRIGATECSPVDFQSPDATHQEEMRRTQPTEPEKVAEFELDMDDDSGDEDWFDEIHELVIKDDLEERVGEIEQEDLEIGLDGLETVSPMDIEVEFDLDKEIRELLGEEIGGGNELFGVDIVNVNSENLEEFLSSDDEPGEGKNVDTITVEELENGLNCLETVFPNKVNEECDPNGDFRAFDSSMEKAMVNEELEVKKKPPDLSGPKSQGMNDFINKLILYLSCRKENERLGKVPVSSCHKKKCNNFCIHFEYLKKFLIFANTKQWFDAWVKQFYGVFVLNEAIVFYDSICLRNGGDGKK